ncbi:unnamed protein product [Somion occarium]|uniref:mRNA-capping enzyme subunit beta n=1 Tax=Somion occarium TaxID=3059160 RepID=A0ABP1DXG3_9APHY
MDNGHYSDSENRPLKRARRTPSPSSSNGHPSTMPPNSSALPPLSLSILGVEPLDEFIVEVADFIHHMIRTKPEGPGLVEVEAKVGVLRDKGTGQRLQLPILVETILSPNYTESRFESNMSPMQHKHFNQLLNKLKTTPGQSSSPVEYQHHHLIDTFYPSDNPRDREKIRVTRDERTGEVKECLKKIRLGSLDIYSPKRAADWRISVNLEVPVPPPIGSSTHSRKKDRLSYSHEEFVIDLTQVTSSGGPNTKVRLLQKFTGLSKTLVHSLRLLSHAA